MALLDRAVFADLVAEALPAQAHGAHDALGRELEGQVPKTAASGTGAGHALAGPAASEPSRWRTRARKAAPTASAAAVRGRLAGRRLTRPWVDGGSYIFRGSRVGVAMVRTSHWAQAKKIVHQSA